MVPMSTKSYRKGFRDFLKHQNENGKSTKMSEYAQNMSEKVEGFGEVFIIRQRGGFPRGKNNRRLTDLALTV